MNSYGKDLGTDYDFADLLAAINAIPGDYWLRFMSSQPKDATNKLFDTMARCEHVAKQLHLPVQSGCDRVLKAMNRPYTRAKYEEMIAYARSVMPGMVLTSDVIIGFPGETEDEAMQTVDLVEKTQFDALFTFIFSPRPGTPAAKMDDPVSREEKQVWFEKLVDAQNAISAKKHAAYIGRTVKVLVDGESDDEAFPLAARTEGNRLVRMKGDQGPDRHICQSEDHRQQHLGALRRSGRGIKKRGLFDESRHFDGKQHVQRHRRLRARPVDVY